jgi:CBS domain-containing protein
LGVRGTLVARLPPAEAMRPEAPASYRPTLLERAARSPSSRRQAGWCRASAEDAIRPEHGVRKPIPTDTASALLPPPSPRHRVCSVSERFTDNDPRKKPDAAPPRHGGVDEPGGKVMKNPVQGEPPLRLYLCAETAADLMAPNPVSLRADATVQEASSFLSGKGFSVAPVIDEAGRPAGVLSLADIVIHGRESAPPASAGGGDRTGRPLVRDLMTPTVFSVAPETPAATVVEQMLALKVHHLFVVGRDGVLTGVISALDVLKYLRPEQPSAPGRVPSVPGRAHAPIGCEPW